MKNNSVIVCVLVLLAGVMFWGTKNMLTDNVATVETQSASWRMSPQMHGVETVGRPSPTGNIKLIGGSRDAFLLSASPYTSVSTQRGSQRGASGYNAATRPPTPSLVNGGGNLAADMHRSYAAGGTLHTTSSSTLHSYGGSANGGYGTSSRTGKDVETIGRPFPQSSGMYGVETHINAYSITGITGDGLPTVSTQRETQVQGDRFAPVSTAVSTQHSAINPTTSTSAPRRIPSMYLAWVQKFAEQYGRQPNDMQELQDFIDWYLGSGLYGKPDPVDDGGGVATLYLQWLDKFYDKYGRYPNDDAELEEFIRWWQGGGVYTEDGAPLGNGLWLMLLLAATTILIKRLKTLKPLRHLKPLNTL